MTILLIDGDILAFSAASAAQRVIGNAEPDEEGVVWGFASLPEGKAIIDNTMARLKDGLKADAFRVALSDPAMNWRKQVLPSYKSNRDDLQRPVLLGHLKDYLKSKYGAEIMEGLEADDVVGIWATMRTPYADWVENSTPEMSSYATYEGAICVSRDKDFQGIPGLHHTLGETDARGLKVREVTPWQAKRFHLIQALSGDRVDGYGGCPGLGMTRAAEIIDNPQRLVPKPGKITSGKNKGKSVTRWFAEPTDDYWACIVSHYLKAGLSEKDALLTARVAKILWANDYDFQTGAIRLWTPEEIRKD